MIHLNLFCRSTQLTSVNPTHSVHSSIRNIATLEFSRRHTHEEKSEKVVPNRSKRIPKKLRLNSYALFVQDQKMGSGATFEEIGRRFRELDESTKKEYEIKCQRLKEEHENKLKNDTEYSAAFQENLVDLKAKSLYKTDFVLKSDKLVYKKGEISNAWKALASEEKHKYLEKAKFILKRSQLYLPPPSIYFLFVSDQEDLANVFKQKGIEGLSKEMVKRYNELDEAAKKKYELKYQRMMEEHEIKLKNDPEYSAAFAYPNFKKTKPSWHLHTEDLKVKKLRIRIEKKAITLFAKVKDICKVSTNNRVIDLWRELSESERENYRQQASKSMNIEIKLPLNSLNVFLEHYDYENEAQISDVTAENNSIALAWRLVQPTKKWNSMSDEEKKIYHDRFEVVLKQRLDFMAKFGSRRDSKAKTKNYKPRVITKV